MMMALGSISPSAAAQDDSDQPLTPSQMVARLEAVQQKVRRIRELYPDAVAPAGGEILNREAFEDALSLAEEARAAFGQEQPTPLFQAIRARSPFIADVLKARVSQLVAAVLEKRPVDDVLGLIEELLPDLNRAVIVAKSKVFPKADRQLKTAQAVRQAVESVIQLVDRSVAQYGQGNVERAAALANDAFFEFESNGLGPDSSLVDEALENEVEADISNFGPGSQGDPGLEQLIRAGVPTDRVEAQRDQITEGLKKIEELLIATLPQVRLGDVNGDGRLTITDALLIAQASLGLRSVDPDAADANCDGRISITDALLVAQASLELRELPEGCRG